MSHFFPLAKTRWKIQWQGYVTTNLEVVIILCLILTTSLEYLKDHTHTLLLFRVIMGVTHVYCCLTFKNTLLTEFKPRLPFHIKNLPNNLFCIIFILIFLSHALVSLAINISFTTHNNFTNVCVEMMKATKTIIVYNENKLQWMSLKYIEICLQTSL